MWQARGTVLLGGGRVVELDPGGEHGVEAHEEDDRQLGRAQTQRQHHAAQQHRNLEQNHDVGLEMQRGLQQGGAQEVRGFVQDGLLHNNRLE